MTERIDARTEYGDAEVAYSGEILRSVVGSGVHGIAIAGTDDHDEMGVYIEPERHVLGLAEYWTGASSIKRVDSLLQDRRGDYTARTQPEGARSGPGDIDLVMYCLKKYLRLAIVGNPTALLPLYAPESDLIVCNDLGKELRGIRSAFLSQYSIHRFLGYMEAQHERMMGEGKRNRVPKRPELEEKYGWDTKYGSHAYRLAFQGLEIATEGTLTLPLQEYQRELVLAVKRGEVPRDEVSQRITTIRDLIQSLLDEGKTAVPERPDVRAIEDWMISAQKRFWAMA
jgi:predicted nucleotidyltransferase